MTAKSKTALANVPALTKSDLALAAVPGSYRLTPDAFDTMGGEIYAGLNILKLLPGEAAGPFRLVKVLVNEDVSGGKKSRKGKSSLVDVYVGEHLASPGREVRMPIAASFIGKAQDDAKLKPGDIFATRRGEDYTDRKYKRACQSYEIRVAARSGPAADAFVAKYGA